MSDRQPVRQEGWTFPLVLPSSRLRRSVQTSLGRVLARALPRRTQRLQDGNAPHDLVDRIVLAGLVSRHRAEGSLDRLAAQHARFWASADAVRFHAATESRFERAFLGAHRDILGMLDAALAPGDISTVCEIGCGNGRVLGHLAARLPQVQRLVGLDLCARQSALNAERYDDPRLDFVAADASAWIPAHAQPGWAYFSYGGVLEYFPQAALAALFAGMALRPPACIALVEPLDLEHDLAQSRDSRPYGAELSFSHNYPHLLAQARFGVLAQHECMHAGLRWLLLAART